MKINLSENIRIHRKQRGLTQEQLAEVFGVSTGAVYKWEAGLSVPELELLVRMADFFDTSVDALLGYELRDNRPEAALNRLREAKQSHDPEGLALAEDYLRKYPNHFEIVRAAAHLYGLLGFERKDEALLRRSIQLYERALPLIPRDGDRMLNEQGVYRSIAETRLSLGEWEEAVALLKAHNGDGRYNDLIGMNLAHEGNRPEESLTYLGDALLACISSITRIAMGYMNAYDALRDYDHERDALRWGIDALSALPGDAPCFLDKLIAALHGCVARVELKLGDEEAARESLRTAVALAERFDAAPDYSTRGLRFASLPERSAYDDLGATALEAVENVIHGDDDPPLAALWKEIKG